ncbi:MAG: hypothetical protein QG670_2782 [Thermoproteota archaeon]|nr:hypothetical protein [Thermoproteota archaeon]
MSDLLENCSICGERMERGLLVAAGLGLVVGWRPPDSDNSNRKEINIVGKRHVAPMTYDGFRCPKCKTIILPYRGKIENKKE